MNRELKFRAWSWGHMLYDVYPTGTSREIVRYEDVTPVYEKVHEHIMQYTGLKDRKGKDIYEGDIAEMIYDEPKPKTMVVVWHIHKYIAIHLSTYKDYLSGIREIYFSNTGVRPDSFDATIIGNIYQNPELT